MWILWVEYLFILYPFFTFFFFCDYVFIEQNFLRGSIDLKLIFHILRISNRNIFFTTN